MQFQQIHLISVSVHCIRLFVKICPTVEGITKEIKKPKVNAKLKGPKNFFRQSINQSISRFFKNIGGAQ